MDFAGWTNGCGCMSHYWWIWKKLGVAELVHYQNKASKMYKCSKYRYIYYVYIDIYDIKIYDNIYIYIYIYTLYMYIVAFGSWIHRLISKSHCPFGAKKEQKKTALRRTFFSQLQLLKAVAIAFGSIAMGAFVSMEILNIEHDHPTFFKQPPFEHMIIGHIKPDRLFGHINQNRSPKKSLKNP